MGLEEVSYIFVRDLIRKLHSTKEIVFIMLDNGLYLVEKNLDYLRKNKRDGSSDG